MLQKILSRYVTWPKFEAITQRHYILAACILLLLIAYITITYYNWKQRQIWENQMAVEHALEKLHNMEGFTSITNPRHTTNDVANVNDVDGIRGMVSSALPIHTKLEWRQVIQPGSPDAANLIKKIDSEYLALMNNQNIAARKKDTISELREFMSHCCLDVSKDEFTHVKKIIGKPRITNTTSGAILQSYLNYWLPKIHLAKSRDGLEYNMPHTHATTMMMPSGWWKHPDYSTFIHEMAHIHQRAHPYEWSPLYEDKWHFKYVPNLGTQVRGLDSIISRSRLNPDGSDFNWLWLGASDGRARWIGAIFPQPSTASNDNVTLTKVDYVSIPLYKVGDTWTLPDKYLTTVNRLPLLANDTDFMQFFGVTANNYHPNELGAQMMETWSNNIGPGNSPSPAMKVFDKWLQELPWMKK